MNHSTKQRAACSHCKVRLAWCRTLCRTCHRDRDVRDATPHVSARGSMGAARGVGAREGHAPPPVPTDAPPGSPRKVEVLAERAAAGQQLFHPNDATLAGEDTRAAG